MSMFIKIKSTEATIPNIANILMDQVLQMEGQMVTVLQGQLEEESAELVISATSYGQNATDRLLAPTVLASYSPQPLPEHF